MMHESNYWTGFWEKYGEGSIGKDEQTQVLRTFNKKPISKELWQLTLLEVEKQIEPLADDVMLELCCGNGLFSRHFSSKVKNIVSVDISEDLLRTIDHLKYSNIEPVVSDIRKLQYNDRSFDKVIIYAGIQYLTLAETMDLFEQVYRWLKPGGIFFLGDIPNYNKRWIFYNTPERHAVFFQNLKEGKDIIGTWFEPEFFDNLGGVVGFKKSVFLPQNPELIYSNFRYDYKLVK